MKNLKLKAVLCSALLTLATTANALQERVVATINGMPIMNSQVLKVLGKRADTPTNRQKALDEIIDDILLQRAIQESGARVNPQAVEHAIETIAEQNGLTYGQLLDALDYQGITLNQFRQNIANQMLMEQVRHSAIGRHIDVTREQVEELSQQLLDKGMVKSAVGTEYRVRHILLKVTPLLDDAKAKLTLSQIRSDIVAGKMSFEEAAKAYSKDYLSGANGGDLGFAFAELYSPEFAKAVRTTKQGVISAPIKSDFGWHILEVTDTRSADRTRDAAFQKAYENLVNGQLRENERNWIRALRKGVEIKVFDK